MSQINRYPAGLQDLLGSKNFGVNPSNLAQSVIPTVEMTPFFQAEFLEIERVDASFGAPGDKASITIPIGENWFVWSAELKLENFIATQLFATRFFIDINQRDKPANNASEYTGIEYFSNTASGPTPGQSWDVAFRDVPVPKILYPSGTEFAHAGIFGTTYPPTMVLSLSLICAKLKV